MPVFLHFIAYAWCDKEKQFVKDGEATMVCGLPSGSSLVLLRGAYVQAVGDRPLRAIFLVVTGVHGSTGNFC